MFLFFNKAIAVEYEEKDKFKNPNVSINIIQLNAHNRRFNQAKDNCIFQLWDICIANQH